MGMVIVFLAGGSVAVGGSIGFIGLIVPHIVRGLAVWITGGLSLTVQFLVLVCCYWLT
jgi:ABC-type Fe3+-siderophore transport system permease subunit